MIPMIIGITMLLIAAIVLIVAETRYRKTFSKHDAYFKRKYNIPR